MDATPPSVSVVVSTYDEQRWDHLVACVESLQGQTAPTAELIVVVDHNPALLRRAQEQFPALRVIDNDRPRGLAGARNAGVAVSTADVVAFIDDDARAEPDWLEQLLTCFDAAETVGAGGALIPDWEDGRPSWVPTEFYWVFGCSYTGLPEERAPVRNPIGANMAARAAALHEVGGFREGGDADSPRELRARGMVRAAGNVPDDTDLAIRVKQRIADAVWLYQPAARVLHSVPAARTSVGYFLRRSFEEGVGKASLARLVGSDASLASERGYVSRVLPRAIVRETGRLLRGDGAAALRILAIVAGTGAAGIGYLSVVVR
ncbi:MAG TPA: glycosyltransferase family 2 protein [Solirubrobacterales bacterium]|jgi:glycosyltransferase involved in cell wall biosynthesis|nr:glycosyltransferase family 2 protein [Solirubrobacterales bacterium]